MPHLLKYGVLNKKTKYNLGIKNKIVHLYYLDSGDNIFWGESDISEKRGIFLSIQFKDNLFSEDYYW